MSSALHPFVVFPPFTRAVLSSPAGPADACPACAAAPPVSSIDLHASVVSANRPSCVSITHVSHPCCLQIVVTLEQRAQRLSRLLEELSSFAADWQAAGDQGGPNAGGPNWPQLDHAVQRQLLQLVPAARGCLGLPTERGAHGRGRLPRHGSTRQQRTQAEIAASFTLLAPVPAGAHHHAAEFAPEGVLPRGPLRAPAHVMGTCTVLQCQLCAYERHLLLVRRFE